MSSLCPYGETCLLPYGETGLTIWAGRGSTFKPRIYTYWVFKMWPNLLLSSLFYINKWNKWKDQPQFMTIYSDEVVLDLDEGIC